MSIFDSIDLASSELPGWLNNLVALARPVAVTMLIAIPAMGSFSVGIVAGFSPGVADAMAASSIKFLQGIPDAGWGAIVAIALGYTAAKTAEVVRAPGGQRARATTQGQTRDETAAPDTAMPTISAEAASNLRKPPSPLSTTEIIE